MDPKWGWKHFAGTGWYVGGPDGGRWYRGYFETFQTETEQGYETCSILFLSRHPTNTMRFICKSGKHPREFDGKELFCEP